MLNHCSLDLHKVSNWQELCSFLVPEISVSWARIAVAYESRDFQDGEALQSSFDWGSSQFFTNNWTLKTSLKSESSSWLWARDQSCGQESGFVHIRPLLEGMTQFSIFVSLSFNCRVVVFCQNYYLRLFRCPHLQLTVKTSREKLLWLKYRTGVSQAFLSLRNLFLIGWTTSRRVSDSCRRSRREIW